MKKLMFAPSILMAGLIAGCTTELVDSRGNPVTDSAGKTVMVSSSTKDRVEKSAAAVRMEIRSEVEKELKSGTVPRLDSVVLSDEAARRLAGPGAIEDDIAAVKALAKAEARKYLLETVYPARISEEKAKLDDAVAGNLAKNAYKQASDAVLGIAKTDVSEIDGPVAAYAGELNKGKVAPAWSEAIVSKLGPFVDKKIAAKDYENAREMLWRAPTTGNPEVDSVVRKFAVEKMHVAVNPSEWTAIEKELKAKVAALESENNYDEAIGWLKAFRRVRTYSRRIDEKLKGVEAELVKLGVPEKNVEPVLQATGELVAMAARIYDATDTTTNKVTTTEGKEIAGFEPDLDAYKAKLESYRKLLVKYDCTEQAANEIAGKFDGEVAPMLAGLSRPGSKEADSVSTESFLQLGTAALNSRIDAVVASLIADMEAKKAAYLKAQREAAILAAIEELKSKVAQLVADGMFAEAREAVWTAAATDDAGMSARLREAGVELLLATVNPSNWAAIESEFAAKTAEAQENASYDDAIAWVEAYPEVRTYAVAIDEKLGAVQAELEKLGVEPGKIEAAVAGIRKATVEVERLANHMDVLADPVAVQNGPSLEEYARLLAEYRATLVLNDCTEANAEALVAGFQAEIAPYIALLSGEGKVQGRLLLGTNAVNDRLAKLRAATLETLKSQKYRHVFDGLVANVTAAVAEGRYADARDTIRDVPLVQDVEWDARIYATRIGLLDSLVNPAQCAALLAEIDAKAKELFDEKKYEEFREYAEGYEFVHDSFAQIQEALAQVKTAMAGLSIGEGAAAAGIDNLSARVVSLLERRAGAYAAEPARDLEELEKALAGLEESIVAQYYRPEDVKTFRETVKQEILAMVSKTPDPTTTFEMNEALAARLASYVAQLDGLIARRDAENEAEKYAGMLADIDAEVSFDSQIAMAEDAIAKQLGIKCPEAYLKLNALLGEYARTMRLLKLGKKIDRAQATVALLGGVYLDQSAVVARALELGADANGTSGRDPLARTAVLIAIQSGHNSFLKQLAEAGASLATSDAEGDTALHYAVRRGNIAVVKAMVAKNGVNTANKAGETALFIAARRNQAAVAAALVEAKADAAAKNSNGQTAMDAACIAGSRDVLDVLADAGAEFGPKQLALAAENDRLAVAQWLVGKGVDVNGQGVMDSTIAKSETKRYLVSEGGIPPPVKCECGKCGCEDCACCKN